MRRGGDNQVHAAAFLTLAVGWAPRPTPLGAAGAGRERAALHGVSSGSAGTRAAGAVPAYAYNVKALRDLEWLVAERADKSYERFVAQWRKRPLKDRVRGHLKPAEPD